MVSPLPCPWNYGSVPGTQAADGAPVDDSTTSVHNGSYLEVHLRQVIAEIENRSSIELVAIGSTAPGAIVSSVAWPGMMDVPLSDGSLPSGIVVKGDEDGGAVTGPAIAIKFASAGAARAAAAASLNLCVAS